MIHFLPFRFSPTAFFSSALLAVMLISSCSLFKKQEETEWDENQIIELDEVEVFPEEKIYNASASKDFDLIHTRLDVNFDWEKHYLEGNALITLKPWFYEQDSLVLDAKGMEIKAVALDNNGVKQALAFQSNPYQLIVQLDRKYTSKDTLSIAISYVAKPDEIEQQTMGFAISDAKGLYFINSDSTETGKPTQIWTQGETESSSCWFPTIDKPNQRMTQEVFITVDDRFKTLSNGTLIYSNYNAGGTRTDYWKMELPHAPYLTMMAIGDFKVASAKWSNEEGKDLMVDYYMEPEYQKYAFNIFGNTPEMMSFYSKILQYDYPWSKYAQVIVRDYVSGAMENTTATIHGEFLNMTDRELLDGDYESIIAHELFHQWFGNLVTCENWANLPLNESFATYGEYLWFEHQYGKDRADDHARESRDGYFEESLMKNEDLIRFDYDDKEDMFDGHSYNKGGAILHMLRNCVGDEAFFASLSKYLHDNAYSDVEIHHLRLAFEAVTGQDLNWFFNQWFLDKGHPVLDITYTFNDINDNLEITIVQTQDSNEFPIFELPLDIDIHYEQEVERHRVWMKNKEAFFSFPMKGNPLLVNVDADKVLLCQKNDQKPESMWKEQFYRATNLMDRYEALSYAIMSNNPDFDDVLVDALKDPFYGVQVMALNNIDPICKRKPEVELHLNRMLESDVKSVVKAEALRVLSANFNENSYAPLYEQLCDDRSFLVSSEALRALYYADPAKGTLKAAGLEKENNMNIVGAIAEIYTANADTKHDRYFREKLNEVGGYDKYVITQVYSEFLVGQQQLSPIKNALPVFEDVAKNSPIWWMKLSGYQSLVTLRAECSNRAEANGVSSDGMQQAEALSIMNQIDTVLGTLVEQEKDPRVRGALGLE
jgi:aminopeptidase N